MGNTLEDHATGARYFGGLAADSNAEPFHAAVHAIVDPGPRGERCDCGSIAEFAVGVADRTGALVADVLQFTCPPHLLKAVTEATRPL